MKQFLLPFALVVLFSILAACVPEHAVVSQPIALPTSAPSTPDTPAIPTATTVPVAEEEDCMAACHKEESPDAFAAGATPLPTNHAGRANCLNCHSTSVAPALHSSHIGRLDPACPLCHKVIAPPK